MADKNSTPETLIELELDQELFEKLTELAGGRSPAGFLGELIEKEWSRRVELVLEPIRRAARTHGFLISALRRNGVL